MSPEERVQAILDLATAQWNEDGQIETTDNTSAADISEGEDNGAYVRAWVWVDFAGTALDKDAEAGAEATEGE